jgi:hypothetical protein
VVVRVLRVVRIAGFSSVDSTQAFPFALTLVTVFDGGKEVPLAYTE